MVEIFKTNVKDQDHANVLLAYIHENFRDYKANFDLEDCDKVLRVKCTTGFIQPTTLIDLLQHYGYEAEVFPDDT